MKMRLAVAALLAVFGAASGVFAQDAPAGARPRLAVDAITHNAGDVKTGETVSHDYIIKNVGNADLEIKGVTPTCGCETISFDKIIAPGKQGKISLQVRTAGYVGPISKSASVTTNDPDRPSFDLTIQFNGVDGAPTGQIIGPFIVSPGANAVGSAVVGEAVNVVMTVYGKDGLASPRIKGVKSDGGIFSVTVEPNAEASRYMIRAVSASDLPVGRHAQNIVLATESAEMPELTLTLEAVVDAPLRVGPAAITIDRVTIPEDGSLPRQSKFVFITQLGGPVLEIRGVSSTLPFLTAAMENSNPGRNYSLRVMFSAVPPKGRHQGKVVIATNIAAQPTIEVGVTVVVP